MDEGGIEKAARAFLLYASVIFQAFKETQGLLKGQRLERSMMWDCSALLGVVVESPGFRGEKYVDIEKDTV